jgi:hypothetical protein
MKKARFITLLTLTSLIISLIFPTQSKIKAENAQSETTNLQKDYGKTSLLFEENRGQTDKEVKYFARANGYQMFLTNDETVFTLKNSDQIKLNFVGANKNAELKGENKAVTISNYFSGQDQSKWLTNIPNFNEVWQKGIYNGIDAKFYGIENKQVEYDFIVSPNADANQIKLNFDGAKDISIDEQGNLVLKTETAELVQNKPIAYQIIEGKRREIKAEYVINEQSQIANRKSQISFELGEYDKSQTLIIDPVLTYSTYIGGSKEDEIHDITADADGNAYIMGGTDSLSFHGETRRLLDNIGIFVGKLDANGQNFLYLTFLESRGDEGKYDGSIAIDAQNNVYIAGESNARDYPTTANAYQRNLGLCIGVATCLANSDAVLTKLNASGNIVYSTYLGGSSTEYGNDVAVDSQGRAYVVGETASGPSFPKKNEFQGTGLPAFSEAFLTVFTADGSDIVYSTALGGNSRDEARGVAIDSNGNAYVTGVTNSNGQFPTKSAFQTSNGGGKDAFVAKFNPALSGESSLVYSTFLGGSGTDEGNAIAVNSGGQAVVTGLTGSVNFPLANAFRSTNQVNEAFVTVLSSTGGSVINSSFLGGSGEEQGDDIKLGANGLIYVSGKTTSNNFPLSQPFQPTRRGLFDAFVTKLRFGSGVLSSSYLGGAGNEEQNRLFVRGNHIYLAGKTESNNLATTAGVIKPSFGGGDSDGYVAKILDSKIDSIGVFRQSPHPNISPTITLTQSTTNIIPVNATFTGGLIGTKGVSGDFDGDGIDTTGSFTNGTWKLRNVNFPTANPPIITHQFGGAGDLPVVGDWNNDGFDTIGVYRPSTQQFLLSNGVTNPQVEITVQFGAAEDRPIAGDFDGDGFDTIAVFRPSTGETFFTSQVLVPSSQPQFPVFDAVAFLGAAEDLPFAGDWNGDGKDGLGLRRPSTNEFFLSDDNINLRPTIIFGTAGSQPIAGDWDGIPNP